MQIAFHSVMAEAAQLVVKNGVGIGVLAEPSRQLALALAWAGLPHHDMSEAQVNLALKAQLADALQCLDTDHVELRRWLVDAGWMRRDGFGRVYQRCLPHDLPARLQPLAGELARLDVASWSRDQRDRLAQQRAQRRQSWLVQQAAQGQPAA